MNQHKLNAKYMKIGFVVQNNKELINWGKGKL